MNCGTTMPLIFHFNLYIRISTEMHNMAMWVVWVNAIDVAIWLFSVHWCWFGIYYFSSILHLAVLQLNEILWWRFQIVPIFLVETVAILSKNLSVVGCIVGGFSLLAFQVLLDFTTLQHELHSRNTIFLTRIILSISSCNPKTGCVVQAFSWHFFHQSSWNAFDCI